MYRILIAALFALATCSPAPAQSLQDLTRQLEQQNAAHAELKAKVSAIEARVTAVEAKVEQRTATASKTGCACIITGICTCTSGCTCAAAVSTAPQTEAVVSLFRLSEADVKAGWSMIGTRWAKHSSGRVYDTLTKTMYLPESRSTTSSTADATYTTPATYYQPTYQPTYQPMTYGYGGFRGSFGGCAGGSCGSGGCAGGRCR